MYNVVGVLDRNSNTLILGGYCFRNTGCRCIAVVYIILYLLGVLCSSTAGFVICSNSSVFFCYRTNRTVRQTSDRYAAALSNLYVKYPVMLTIAQIAVSNCRKRNAFQTIIIIMQSNVHYKRLTGQ